MAIPNWLTPETTTPSARCRRSAEWMPNGNAMATAKNMPKTTSDNVTPNLPATIGAIGCPVKAEVPNCPLNSPPIHSR